MSKCLFMEVPEISLLFLAEIEVQCFHKRQKPSKHGCRACHIDKVRSMQAHNRLQQLMALALWEFPHINKSSSAEQVIIC